MKALVLSLLGIGCIALFPCSAQRPVSTLEFSNYSKKSKITTYSVIPFGSVSVPGTWRKRSQSPVSHEQNFTQGDSLELAVAINRAQSYPFFRKELTSDQLVTEFYEWDSKYLVEVSKGERRIVRQDTINHFLIWKFDVETSKQHTNRMYLFGSERGVMYNLNISTDSWNDERKEQFLLEMFRSRMTGDCCS